MSPCRLLVVALIAMPLVSPCRGQQRVSKFGRYEGYSQPRFDGWAASSRYLEMRDGVRLAIDVVRPTRGGVATDEPLPVVWTHSRYHRNPSGIMRAMGAPAANDVGSMVDVMPDLQRLVRHGYVVAAAGVRGSGASFGRYEGLFSPAETDDAFEITQWLAAQPWCDGNVGMFGGSYLGMTQYMAASEAPPALKAIFPVVAGFDLYEVIYPGGVFRDDMVAFWSDLTTRLDREWTAPRVDGDDDGAELRAAIAAHEDSWPVLEGFRAAPFRDSTSGDHAWSTHNPAALLAAINDARVPAYHWGGWLDIFALDATIWFANYAGPQKLAMGAWAHGPTPDRTLMAERLRLRSAEQHRWFDFWLKGVDNGVMDEPAVHYATIEGPGRWSWHAAPGWPPPGTTPQRLFFAAGPSGSIDSVNDGRLVGASPDEAGGVDRCAVDFTTTTGTSTRWDNAVGVGAMVYPDLSANGRKTLTYTSEPLEDPLTVTGHPIVTLWASSTAEDGAFFALLEEVDPDGVAHYVTEGVLRGSQRQERVAAWNNLALPYHRCHRADRMPLVPGEPSELRFDLHPTSTTFDSGSRIRVTVMGADLDNTEEIAETQAPTIRVLRDSAHPSGIELPVGAITEPSSPGWRVAAVLEQLHRGTAHADAERYFACFASDAVFLGTDATERWTLPAFKAFAKPHFDRGTGWTYHPIERRVTIGPEARTAWFDELLHNAKYGTCRGTGVLTLDDDAWRIEQYNLTIPVPNDVAPRVVELIRGF